MPQADLFDSKRTKAILEGAGGGILADPFGPDVRARTKAILAPQETPKQELPKSFPGPGWDAFKHMVDSATFGMLSQTPKAEQSKEQFVRDHPRAAEFADVVGKAILPTLAATGGAEALGAGAAAAGFPEVGAFLTGASRGALPLRVASGATMGAEQGLTQQAIYPNRLGYGGNALLGGVLGGGLKVLGSPFYNAVSPQTAQNARTYIGQGIPIRTFQIPGAPFAARAMAKILRMQPADARDLTKQLVAATGHSADHYDANTGDAIEGELGDKFNKVAQNVQQSIATPNMLGQLEGVWQQAQAGLPGNPQALEQIKSLLTNIYAAGRSGKLNGEVYQNLTQKGGPISNLQKAGHPIAQYANATREVLDDALQQAAPEQAAQIKLLRNQYRNYIVLNSIKDDGTGIVDPNKAYSAVLANYKGISKASAAAANAGNPVDIGALAAGGKQFVPQSATGFHLTPGQGMGLGILAGEHGQDLVSALAEKHPLLALGGAGMAFPYSIGGALMNTPLFRDALLAGGGNFLPRANMAIPMAAETAGYTAQPGPRQYSAASYMDTINAAGKQYGQSPVLLTRQLQQESGFNPYAVSATGAAGLGQFEPATAKQYGVDVNDPISSIMGTARYMRDLQARFGNEGLALAAYNWGPGNVSKWLRNGADPAKMPSETRNYVSSITQMPITSFLGSAGSAPGLPVQDNKPLVGVTPTPVWQDPGVQ